MTEPHCKPAIVAPTYNNVATLPDILTRLAGLNIDIYIVNDGSTDATAEVLADFVRQHPGVSVLAHTHNRGKAAAMQAGFAAARNAGHTHAVTIDTDGQLYPEQIPSLLDVAQKHPEALIIGARDIHAADYPSRSRFGRRISNHLVRLESGVRVSDSQCGLRVYPLAFVDAVRCRAQRFGFETEIISRAGWSECPVLETPVNCRYLPAGQRISHFRPFVDSARAVWMHGRLLLRALTPWPHVRWPDTESSALPSVGSIWKWLSPKSAWHQLRHEESGHAMTATGLAIGVFIANLPIYGVQTLFSIYASRRLHLHPAPVVLGSQISTPPIGIAMIITAIYVGHMLLHGAWPAWPPGGWSAQLIWDLAPSLFQAWLLGSLIVGAVMATATYFVSLILLRVAIPRRPVSEPAD